MRLVALRPHTNDVLRRFFDDDSFFGRDSFYPALDLIEEKEQYVLKTDLPGVSKARGHEARVGDRELALVGGIEHALGIDRAVAPEGHAEIRALPIDEYAVVDGLAGLDERARVVR